MVKSLYDLNDMIWYEIISTGALPRLQTAPVGDSSLKYSFVRIKSSNSPFFYLAFYYILSPIFPSFPFYIFFQRQRIDSTYAVAKVGR